MTDPSALLSPLLPSSHMQVSSASGQLPRLAFVADSRLPARSIKMVNWDGLFIAVEYIAGLVLKSPERRGRQPRLRFRRLVFMLGAK